MSPSRPPGEQAGMAGQTARPQRAAAPAGPSPQSLLVAARTVLDRPDALAGHAWAPSAALLARQALEAAVAHHLRRHAPGMEACKFTTRLVALRFYVDDPDVAREAHHTWCSLSRACHHHSYELAPTAGELSSWLDAVAGLIEHLATGDS